MKIVNELLAELEKYLKDEIKSCEQSIPHSITDSEYYDFWGRKAAYQEMLSWVTDHKHNNT